MLMSWLRRKRSSIARQSAMFLRLPMPAMGARALAGAVRLQLRQILPFEDFGFVFRTGPAGGVEAWAWPATAGDADSEAWPEPLLEAGAPDGMRLVRRAAGFELQRWLGARLTHSLWVPECPDAQAWSAFVRGCGENADAYPLPPPGTPAEADAPARGWTRGASTPPRKPWRIWGLQLAVAALLCLLAFTAAWHFRLRDELRLARVDVAELRQTREAALRAQGDFEQAQRRLADIRQLVPRTSQSELLSALVQAGVFAPDETHEPVPAPAPVAAAASAPATPVRPTATLQEWDYRGGKLKFTIDLPEAGISLTRLTRKLESVRGLADIRVGQDSGPATFTVSATWQSGLAPRAGSAGPSFNDTGAP